MSAMEDLAKQVRICIDRGEFSMTSLAKEVGCTRQHLHAVLASKHKMSLSLAEKIAAAVGCELRVQTSRKKISL